ncbi:MAG: cupin domain-containing protein [Bacteroidota bacterium]
MAEHIKTEECLEYYFEERCFIRELLNTADSPNLSIAQARVEPGVTTVLHSLKGMELYYILSGEGLAEVAAQQCPVGAGDLIRIEAGERQRITNTGLQDLLFLAICTPRFIPENYSDLEAKDQSSNWHSVKRKPLKSKPVN